MNKSDYPIFKNNSNLTYLDSAATAQNPHMVTNAIKNYYESINANIHRGIYELSEKSTDAYEEARVKVAKFVGAKPNEIIFTSGTTDSINSLSRSLGTFLTKGDTILVTEYEHHSNLLPWIKLANEKKLKLKYIPVSPDLSLDLDFIKTTLSTSNSQLLTLTGMSNVTGYIPDIGTITKLAHKNGVLVSLDAAQLVPHKRIDVKKLDVDFLSFSGHKLYGPTGIGVLYVAEEILAELEPYNVGGGMITEVLKHDFKHKEGPEGFEAGTPNIAGAIGLSVAVDYVESIGFEKIINHEKELTDYLVKKLKELNEIELYLAPEGTYQSVISLNVHGVHAHDTADILSQNNVAVRAGHHCCQVFMRDVLDVNSTIRVSLGIYNDRDDIDKLIEALKKVVTTFK